MRIIIHLILVLICLFSTITAAGSGMLGGSGTEIDPYIIESLEDFQVFASGSCAEKYWAEGVSVQLECDLDLRYLRNERAIAAADKKSKSLDNDFKGVPFAGIFDGAGHTIQNMFIHPDGKSDYLGLFGKLTGTVKNVKLENAQIASSVSSNYIGGICGLNEKGVISNCEVSGIIYTKNNCFYLGGICGGNSGGMINNCEVRCSIRTGQYCRYIGGLSGYNEMGYISRSFAECRINASDCCVSLGGLCGANTHSSIISNCYSMGSMEGAKRNTYVGGLSGINSHNSYILSSYSTCKLVFDTTSSQQGGLCGCNSSSIKNCFWDIECSGVESSSGGIGLSRAKMLEAATYADAGWDVENSKGCNATWQVTEKEYPVLTPLATELTADFNSDGEVNILDIGYISARWLEDNCGKKNWCDRMDLDKSGEIDNWDIMIVLDEWLTE